MKTQNKFWWFVVVAIASIGAVLCTLVVLFWTNLSIEQKTVVLAIFKEDFAYIFSALFLILAAVGFALDWFFRFYFLPVHQLADETELIHSVNPNLRIKIEGSHDVVRLVESINRFAQQQTKLQSKAKGQHEQNQIAIEAEKNIFATLMEDLPQGILICNLHGRIVFYNRKIKHLLACPLKGFEKEIVQTDQWIGLGRSIYFFIHQTLIAQALERIETKLAVQDEVPIERFLIDTPITCMLPAELVPILDREHHITGFIILIEDQMTRHQREKELDLRLQEWRHKLIQSIAVISSTSEILADTPPDNVEDLKSMNQILLSEAKSAAGLLKQAEWLADLTSAQPWPLTPIKAEEWGRLLQERANEIPGMKLDLQTYEPLNMISIDPHHLTLTVVYLLKRLKDELEFKKFTAELSGKGHWIYLDCQWQGARLDYYTFESWKLDAPKSDNIMLSNSIEEILEFHGAKLWIGQRKGSAETHGMLLLLPVQENKKAFQEESRMTVISDSRPEFYDFNLFQQAGQSADMDKRLLAELSYTVFDTETTGLNPRGGDEIISIGAVRIVNSRLLQEEAFDQLVNPRRQVPWSSVKYHGINPELLEGKPYIEDVLPRFYDFARDTILIGHNVAFDMLMLQQKESISKVRFDQPILDTLLLSDVIHPAHKEHSIEAVAERLGVLVKERHTALGDANTTAEIFLKLLPLLAARGIHTLGQARQACEKTYYARLKY